MTGRCVSLHLRWMRFFALVLLVSAVAGCAAKPVERLSFAMSVESLLERLTSVTAVAERPLGQSYLVSTYDRRGGNQDWAVWTKADADGYVTLLDVDGPGYVSRIWRTNVKIHNFAFFFDGESKPSLVLTHEEMFGGKTFPFLSPLSGESGGGYYCLMPIPFARHMRIAVKPVKLDAGTRNYYHINYTLLADVDGKHESWPRTLSAAQSHAVRSAVAEWGRDREALTSLASQCLEGQPSIALSANETHVLFDNCGSGSVAALAIKIDEPAGAELLNAELLRMLRLQIWWDGNKVPSVDVPLGDFFCNAFYTREFASSLLGRVADTYVSRLPMPYRKGARCVIRNDSPVPVKLRMGFLSGETGADSSRRFLHASWRASETSGRPFSMLKATGPGHYVGCLLTAIGQDGSWNILEGDEFIIADGDRERGQYGTGLEDYFSGAYYYTGLFDLPQHGLIEKGAMRTDQYRFHGLEPVEFDKTLEMGIEFGDQNRAKGYMSSVAYWYADRPHDVTIPDAMVPLLKRPEDRFELAGFMAQMFTLERAALWADAATRCDAMAERYAQAPWVDLLRVRAAAYRERFVGLDAVRSEYTRLAGSKFPPAAQQAQELLWFHEDQRHALLGMHIRGQYTLWLDGKEIDQADSKAVLRTRRLVIAPGRHEWEIEMTPTLQGSMVSLCLRTHWGDITSAGEWDIVHLDPLPGREPPKKFEGAGVLPNMTVWQFEPNAHVGMQSGKQLVTTWAFWDGRPMVKRVRMKQAWTNGPGAVVPGPPSGPIERSEAEEKAHAIN